MPFPKTWHEIVVESPPEALDAVIYKLLQMGATGAIIEDRAFFSSFPTIRNGHSEVKTIKAYLQDGEQSTHTKTLHAHLKFISSFFPNLVPGRFTIRPYKEASSDNWKKHFRTTWITDTLVIKPSWEEITINKPYIKVIEIDPQMAFGIGSHQTTKMCLKAVELYIGTILSSRPNLTVLDVGTGTGILCIAAAKMGAKKVLGIDIDKEAIQVAKNNAKKNGVDDIFTISDARLKDVSGVFDVVIANIIAHELLKLRTNLVRKVPPNGYLINSGII